MTGNVTGEQPSDKLKPTQRGASNWRFVGLLALVVAVFAATWMWGKYLSLPVLAGQEQSLRDFQTNNPWLVYGIAFVVYALATGVSIPGATVLTLVYGWYFGWLRGVVLVSFASTTGATIAFLLSRYFLGDWVQSRYGDRLQRVNEAFQRDGAWYLLTLRLIFSIPFFLVNLLMGLTPVRASTYWLVSQVGMLPATVIYVYAGSRVPSLRVLAEEGVSAAFTGAQILQFALALGLLGAFPLVVKFLVRRLARA